LPSSFGKISFIRGPSKFIVSNERDRQNVMEKLKTIVGASEINRMGSFLKLPKSRQQLKLKYIIPMHTAYF